MRLLKSMSMARLDRDQQLQVALSVLTFTLALSGMSRVAAERFIVESLVASFPGDPDAPMLPTPPLDDPEVT